MGISKAEAARRAGISRPALEKHIRAGRITIIDGTIDEVSFVRWRDERARAMPLQPHATQVASGSKPGARIEAAVDGPEAARARAAMEALEHDGVFSTRAEAERYRDSYIAQLRRIEFEERDGQVVDASEVAAAVGREYAAVRTRLLALPAETAPQLHRCRTVNELQDLLYSLIVESLEALTEDRPKA